MGVALFFISLPLSHFLSILLAIHLFSSPSPSTCALVLSSFRPSFWSNLLCSAPCLRYLFPIIVNSPFPLLHHYPLLSSRVTFPFSSPLDVLNTPFRVVPTTWFSLARSLFPLKNGVFGTRSPIKRPPRLERSIVFPSPPSSDSGRHSSFSYPPPILSVSSRHLSHCLLLFPRYPFLLLDFHPSFSLLPPPLPILSHHLHISPLLPFSSCALPMSYHAPMSYHTGFILWPGARRGNRFHAIPGLIGKVVAGLWRWWPILLCSWLCQRSGRARSQLDSPLYFPSLSLFMSIAITNALHSFSPCSTFLASPFLSFTSSFLGFRLHASFSIRISRPALVSQFITLTAYLSPPLRSFEP